MKFKDFALSTQLQHAIHKLGHDTPTEIQEKSLLPILKGKDLMGESATGSGKTLAFGCGIIETVKPGQGLQAVVLTPTRELADQVKDVIVQLSYQKDLHILAVYGGVAIEPQIKALQRAHVVVATPGRFMDHLQRGTLNTSAVKILVLDEADRMFDMGFIDDVQKIIQSCKNRKQTLFFSATLSPQIKSLARKFMHDPVEVSAVKMVDPKKLKQVYYDIPRNMKVSLLIHLLRKEKSGLIMVFCNTRRTTDVVVKNLRANKLDAIAIHGGFSQNKRTNTLDTFNKGKIGVLVCTDVAARGLHIDDVSHVYNYDIPRDPKDYVHRIGRTARAGKEGKVVNLLCDYDYDNFSKISQEYREFKIEKLDKGYIEKVDAVFVSSERPRFGGKRPFHEQRKGFRGSRRPEHKPLYRMKKSYNL